MIDISKLDKAEVLKILYDNAKPMGLGLLHYIPEPMTLEEANKLLKEKKDKYFDYLQGRCMKVDLNKDEFDPRLYDRDYGQGTAEKLISQLKEK